MKQAGKEIPTTTSLDALMQRMNDAYHLDENTSVKEYLNAISLTPDAKGRIKNTARTFVETVRANRKRFGGLDSFLQEFGLSTSEGIALMCLAEALLRIPDPDTADKLIRDKIGSADWDQHLGKGHDLFVNASTWALMLTGKVIGDIEEDKDSSIAAIAGRMVSKLGEPIVRRAMLHSMKIMGQQFVMGRTIDEAIARAAEAEKTGYRHSYDMLGEGARSTEDAERYFANYEMAINAIGRAAAGRGPVLSPGLSVKLSAIHPRFEYTQRHLCVPALSEKLLVLAQKCAHYGIGLTVDAEEAHRLEMTLNIVENVFTDPSLKGWDGFGLAVQAYQKRSGRAIDWLTALAEQNNRRMMVRLVKGAYWDSEIKYAQVNGLPGYPVFTRKNATDVAYLANAAKLMNRRDLFYPMFATHNAYTVAALIELAGKNREGFEFQRLHGMGEPLYHQIVGFNAGQYPCRVYAPVGSHQDLLPYLVRRLLENGANSSFVNRLQNDKVPIDEIISDPVEYIAKLDSKPHPKIPLPARLYGTRENSSGIEFASTNVSAEFLKRVSQFSEQRYAASPVINGVPKIAPGGKVLNPADRRQEVGAVSFAAQEDMEQALKTTHAAFAEWNGTSANERAACLERMADLLEENNAEFISLCIRESGKTLPDSVAEVREAADFCRYYAAEGRKHFGAPLIMPGPTGESNTLSLYGRGVFLCISPWNFPLAIFLGQVSAALMAGNAVIAKPAEQTSLIAMKAVELLFKAGVPKDVVALLPATGEMTGKYLVPDERIAGVCFTGSTEVAQLINRSLAARKGAIVPLIAETGGQNAMIADSSALPEQIVDDVITSAFRSAGQRCSALRVLFIQDGIADKVIKMLDGACQELVLGDPANLFTDIGPVIDQEALGMLEQHAEKMDKEAIRLTQVPMTKECEHGYFFAPRAYGINSLAQLPREVFGPVLHVIRYRAGELDQVIGQINATGYGLTFGIHTRIDHQMRAICAQVNAGNYYVNRSMIGAVVGVQPFGGQGLSGTGPKAGGPHYLMRFATERTTSINTTASGGNTTLVSLAEE
jgi:RHH-type proline utilization regulon transcriptional repressor/proline dehydrogenase/delta 1-pyrroline-5-carboxylate dehydrogenase